MKFKILIGSGLVMALLLTGSTVFGAEQERGSGGSGNRGPAASGDRGPAASGDRGKIAMRNRGPDRIRNSGWGDRDRYREHEQQHRDDHDWRLDPRHNHNHYYPRPGSIFRELPGDYRDIRFHRDHYYYHGGSWFRRATGGFTVVIPPFGLRVPFLPPFYTTIWARGIPYYYADDVYYRWLPEVRSYEVSEAPPENEVIEESSLPKDLFIYPKKAQSQAQQDTDRYECHRWSVEQTSFDPTQPNGNVPVEQNTAKRSDYQRAMKACLEARDYSVQ